MASPPKCANCNHPPHPGKVCNVGPCDCTDYEAASLEGGAVFGPIAAHGTDTSDGTWDGPAAEANCPTEAAALRASHAWVDPDGDPDAKASYRFVHHEVSADGKVGAANLTACSTTIGVLNGGRGGTKIPEGDYDGVYNHAARHLTDGGREPPEKNYRTGGAAMAGTDTKERAPTRQFAKTTPDLAPVVDPAGTPYKRWRMPVAVLEGVRTGDGRRIATEALTWRDLPQPLMANTATAQGHDGAELVGRIDYAERVDASRMIDSRTGKPYGKGAHAVMLSGVFTNDELAAKVAQLVADRFLRGVSVDLSDVEYELAFVDDDGEPIEGDGNPIDGIEGLLTGDAVEMVTKGRIMGATITPFPAFEGAFIELVDDDGNVGPATQPGRPTAAQQKVALRISSDFASRSCEPCSNGQPLVAGGGPQYPPQAWFEDPKLDAPTPLTILDDGRLVFHLALWDTCHTGYTGQCVKAPHSAIDYALFRTGVVKTAEGALVATGPLTVDTGHAGLHDSRLAALRHYDHTGTAVADVVVGEDSFGIWCAGALRPDVTENQLRVLRASAASGDWREWGGNLELIAILAVNTPGLPVIRQLVASGMPQALLAGGGLALRTAQTVSAEINDLTRFLPELRLMRQNRLNVARDRVQQARLVAARARLASSSGSAVVDGN